MCGGGGGIVDKGRGREEEELVEREGWKEEDKR